MSKSTYINMINYFREHPRLSRLLIYINRIITYGVFLLYPFMIAYLTYIKSPILLKAILVPLDSFIVLSVSRFMLNRPRPYEKFDTNPIIDKDTKGKSFPSRHVFSAFIISFTCLWCVQVGWLSGILIAGALLLAIIRVLLGVHFVSDVIAGALFALVVAYLGYIII